jgi:hypothetical protein
MPVVRSIAKVNANELKQRWREASDRDVIQAATVDVNGYDPHVQAIIEHEVERRGLVEEVEQKTLLFAKQTESEASKPSKTTPEDRTSTPAHGSRLLSIPIGAIGIVAVALLARPLSLSNMDTLVGVCGVSLVALLLWQRKHLITIALAIAGIVLIFVLERVFPLTPFYVLIGLIVLGALAQAGKQAN